LSAAEVEIPVEEPTSDTDAVPPVDAELVVEVEPPAAVTESDAVDAADAAPEIAADDVAPEAVEPEPVAAEPGIEGTPVMAPPGNGSGMTTIGAAIDVGANSVPLLVAAAGGHHLEPLLDESVFLGLGDRVARDGRIGSEARAEVVRALAQYV